MDKFNNISSTSNSINDRIINRITIKKDNMGKMNFPGTFVAADVTSTKAKQQFISRSQESIFLTNNNNIQNQNNHNNNNNDGGVSNSHGLSLGISIVQGADNNVYVKDLVKNGPGQMNGIHIGDQVSFICFICVCVCVFLYYLFFFYCVPIK